MMHMMQRWIFLAIIFGSSFGLSFAQIQQPKFNSPYSRFGLGDFVNPSLSQSMGMGSIAAGIAETDFINVQNPASLGSLRNTTFDIGLFAQRDQLKTSTTTAKVWDGNISGLQLAFPMYNSVNEVLEGKPRPIHWGMGFGIQPYAQVGYEVSVTEFQTGLDTVNNLFSGAGSYYKLTWSNGVSYKNWSFGTTLGYLFGRTSDEKLVTLKNIDFASSNVFIDDITIRGFVWNLGTQYRKTLKQQEKDVTKAGDTRLTIGAYGHGNMNFNTSTGKERYRFDPRIGRYDTIVTNAITEGRGTLPTEITVGVVYEVIQKMQLGLDIGYGAWKNYENEAKVANFGNTFSINAGMEIIPNYAAYNKYLKRVRYRVGAFYRQDPRIINEQLTAYGISIGGGFPVILPRQQKSTINLALEVGQRGANQEISQLYGRLLVGFTLNDSSWFYKRKFN